MAQKDSKDNTQDKDAVVDNLDNIQIDDIDDPLLARFMKNAKALQIPDDGIREYIEKCYERYERQMSREQSEKDHDYRMAIEETKQRSIQLDIEKVKAQTMNVDSANDGLKNQGLFRDKLPHMKNFDEKTHKIEDYLHRFEHTAERCGWKKEDWAYKLSCYLDDNALSLYYDFTKENKKVPWDTFKAELLKHFRCTSEGFRKKFRELKPEQNESLNKYKSTLMRYFNRWLELSNLSDTKDDIINLFLGEQFLEICSADIASDIRYRKITNFEKMIEIAEDFRLAYPDKPIVKKSSKSIFCPSNLCEAKVDEQKAFQNDDFVQESNAAFGAQIPFSNQGQNSQGRGFRPYRSNGFQGGRPNRYLHSNRGSYQQGNYQSGPYSYGQGQNNNQEYNYGSSQRGGGNFKSRGGQNSNQGNGPIFVNNEKCILCHGIGHVPSQCLLRFSRNPCSVCGVGGHKRKDCPFVLLSENGTYNPTGSLVISDTQIVCSVEVGKLHFDAGKVNETECSVLRDTGATICGVRKRLVCSDQYVPGKVLCKTFGGEIHEYPMAKVRVSSKYFTGELVCCVLEDPVADLIIGNIPQVRESDCNTTRPTVSVSTRAQTKAEKIPQKPLCDIVEDLNIGKKELSNLQRDDKELANCFKMAESGEKKSVGVAEYSFYTKDMILYRSFVKQNQWFNQIVVPKKLRASVLATAHDQLLAGHCGVRRTQKRILTKFFWPGLSVDVTKYIRTCDICQKTTSKGKVPPVPLASMPLIGTPFDRVAIDLVGPLSPPSEQGHRYILTLIDLASRFPEAVPMKDISTTAIVEALFSIFTRLGFPKEILSDRGPQFVSDLMKQFQNMIGTKGVTTSVYHPQSNGNIERFHSTMKSMMKKVIRAQPKQWHRYLPALMFACRELPSESTGFSPFELLFGRRPRGPISLLADSWTEDNQNPPDFDQKPLYQYLFELKNIIRDTCDIAVDNSSQSSKRSKKYFDRRAKDRSFSIDDEVLVLLPTNTNKLLMSWSGPYRVSECFHPDYKVMIGEKSKVFHANMLKKYHRRSEYTNECSVISEGKQVPWQSITSLYLKNENDQAEVSEKKLKHTPVNLKSVRSTNNVGIVHEDDDSIQVPSLPMTSSMQNEDISMIDFNKDLSELEHNTLYAVYKEFEEKLTPKPGCFNDEFMLDINLTSDTVIRKKAYDLPFSSKQIVEREIKTMLELGVIEKSKSSFSSPVVLVKKPDSSCRFCIDFRSLNKIIQFDAEPIPDVDELFTRIAESRYFTRIDLSKGYWQIVVNPIDRPKTAFATHMGLFQWVRMPFGLVSAPACFARMMRLLCLEEHSAMNFFDDILIHSRTFKDHTEHIRGVMNKLKKFNLTARPSKISTGYKSLEFLGHVVGEGLLRPEMKKVKKILAIPTPTTKKQVRSLMGLLSFYRRYIPNFASLTAPISDLTKNPNTRTISWTPDCEEALSKIKHIFSISPVLQLPRLDLPFILRTDASCSGLGAVLLQDIQSTLHPVSFASRKMLDRECRYSTIERECLAIVWGITKFSKFLWGTHFILQTDHRPLTFLRTSRFKNSRIMRWALSLQEYKFEVQPVPGTQNILADLLSRSNIDQSVP